MLAQTLEGVKIMTDKKFLVIEIISIFAIVAGIAVIVFPKITDFLYKEDVQKTKTVFIEEISDVKNEGPLDELYKELQARNLDLYDTYQEDLKDPFSYEQPEIDLSEYGLSDNIIGFVNIPKIGIELPIILGANKANMLKGAVHLTETSYPIGGLHTNSVIAAHRGYKKTEMWKNIDKLELGDEIYIRNFRETLTYKAIEIKIIAPDDVADLKIQDGKDLVTLLTCHPYRSNLKRYVVVCERV